MDINANEQININMAVQNTMNYMILFISCNLSNGYDFNVYKTIEYFL